MLKFSVVGPGEDNSDAETPDESHRVPPSDTDVPDHPLAASRGERYVPQFDPPPTTATNRSPRPDRTNHSPPAAARSIRPSAPPGTHFDPGPAGDFSPPQYNNVVGPNGDGYAPPQYGNVARPREASTGDPALPQYSSVVEPSDVVINDELTPPHYSSIARPDPRASGNDPAAGTNSRLNRLESLPTYDQVSPGSVASCTGESASGRTGYGRMESLPSYDQLAHVNEQPSQEGVQETQAASGVGDRPRNRSRPRQDPTTGRRLQDQADVVCIYP